MKNEKNVYAKMRDGVRLAVDVYRPDAPGRFPGLLAMSPYSKDVQALVGVLPHGTGFTDEWGILEAGNSEYFVSRGYAHVIADIRGVGNSEGTYYNMFSKQEQEDGYDLVEWIAQQPWCDGNVGMVGISYFAVIQYLVAAQQPPHLKAIFPHDGWGDLYRDIASHGGVPSLFNYYLPREIPSRAVPISETMYSKEELKRRVEELIEDEATNYSKDPHLLHVLLYPHVFPVPFDYLVNRNDGPFYRERSPVEVMNKIKVPTYLGSEFHGYPVCMHLPGAISGWEKINAPKKLAFREYPGGVERPFHQFHDEIVRWYDYWLKGIDTGIMDEPPIKIWVRGAEKWRYERAWPLLEKTEWLTYYLRQGNLVAKEPPTGREPSDSLNYKPAAPTVLSGIPISPKPDYLVYSTEPFKEDMEVIGPISLSLFASITSDDADFLIALREMSPDGTAFVLTRGWLKASHRELDQQKSRPWKPYHVHTNPTPVEPGRIYEYPIEIQPIANLFRKGQRLQLEIWPCDYPQQPYDWTQYWGAVHHIPYGKEVTYEIHHTPDHPSHLLLPLITKQ